MSPLCPAADSTLTPVGPEKADEVLCLPSHHHISPQNLGSECFHLRRRVRKFKSFIPRRNESAQCYFTYKTLTSNNTESSLSSLDMLCKKKWWLWYLAKWKDSSDSQLEIMSLLAVPKMVNPWKGTWTGRPLSAPSPCSSSGDRSIIM